MTSKTTSKSSYSDHIVSDVWIAVEALRKGECVALPTETVYGLAADATNDKAIAKIYELKQRPQFNPLIVHVPDIIVAQQTVQFNDNAFKLAKAFWPAPLTFVLPIHPDSTVSKLAAAGLDTLAVRIPADRTMHSVLKKLDQSVVAPSANLSGTASPTTAQHVLDSFGNNAPLILDGGACEHGLESTVIDLSDPQKPTLLRPGPITIEQISKVLGQTVITSQQSKISSPGMLEKHYSIGLPLRLNAHTAEADEFFLAFGKTSFSHPHSINLSESGNLTEAAANLFSALHDIKNKSIKAKLKKVAIMPIPMEGIGIAINDRLNRAAKT